MPRPLRGIVQLHDSLDNLTLDRIGRILGGGVAHEVGHYWLVPGKARIRVGQGEIETPTSEEIWRSLNLGYPIPPYPIIARQDAHWSPYIDGCNSPMDAINHGSVLRENGCDHVTCERPNGPTFDVPDIGQIQTRHNFSPLERYVMGDLDSPEIDPHRETFSIIEPTWAYPRPFQSGLFIELDDNARWYLGFHEGPHQVIVQRADGIEQSNVILISNPYDPDDRVGMRVVLTGSLIEFQIQIYRPWRFRLGCLGSGVAPLMRTASKVLPFEFTKDMPATMIMADLVEGQQQTSDDPRRGWLTLATTNGSIRRVGISSRCTQAGATYVLTKADLCMFQDGGIESISPLDLDEDIPKEGPQRLSNGGLMMPYTHEGGDSVYQENAAVQEAPKLLRSAPRGDFAFGGVIKLERSAIVNWAGQGATGITLVGRRKEVRFDDFILPWQGDDLTIRRSTPPNNEYKMLFCLAARSDSDITETRINGLDRIRRCWEVYFEEMMHNRRANTNVP